MTDYKLHIHLHGSANYNTFIIPKNIEINTSNYPGFSFSNDVMTNDLIFPFKWETNDLFLDVSLTYKNEDRHHIILLKEDENFIGYTNRVFRICSDEKENNTILNEIFGFENSNFVEYFNNINRDYREILNSKPNQKRNAIRRNIIKKKRKKKSTTLSKIIYEIFNKIKPEKLTIYLTSCYGIIKNKEDDKYNECISNFIYKTYYINDNFHKITIIKEIPYNVFIDFMKKIIPSIENINGKDDKNIKIDRYFFSIRKNVNPILYNFFENIYIKTKIDEINTVKDNIKYSLIKINDEIIIYVFVNNQNKELFFDSNSGFDIPENELMFNSILLNHNGGKHVPIEEFINDDKKLYKNYIDKLFKRDDKLKQDFITENNKDIIILPIVFLCVLEETETISDYYKMLIPDSNK